MCAAVALGIAAVLAAPGCASPPYRVHPGAAARAGSIRTVGVLRPQITSYEEQMGYELVPHEEWSRESTETVLDAFVREGAAQGMSVVALGAEDREAGDLLDLFSVVDFSVLCHAFDASPEFFPEQARSFDYALGPAEELMDRHSVDAVWIVAATNLLPTAGARFGDTMQILGGVVSAMGKCPAPVMVLEKLLFRAALIDRSGTVLFYGVVGADRVHVDAANSSDSEAATASVGAPDLRDPAVAERCIRALLAEYREAVPR